MALPSKCNTGSAPCKTVEEEVDDVICLSSDTDDEGLSKDNVKTSKVKPKVPFPYNPIKKNGHHRVTSIASYFKMQVGTKEANDVVLEDEAFEIEYSKDVPANENATESIHNDNDGEIMDSDDEIQILNENTEATEDSAPLHLSEASSESLQSQNENLLISKTLEGGASPSTAQSSGLSGEKTDPAEEQTRLNLKQFLTGLQKSLQHKPKEYKKVAGKVLAAYKNIMAKPLDTRVHIILQETIQNAITALEVNPEKRWSTIKNVLEILEPTTASSLADSTPAQRQAQREADKKKTIDQYEKQLKKMQDRIRELETAEVDWDAEDDHNSPYILVEKLKVRMMQAFYKLCDLTRCNYFTDRSVQKRINLQKSGATSGYSDIDAEVEIFLNRKGCLFVPDFNDIQDITKRVNTDKKLGMTVDLVFITAKDLFAKVVHIIKKRRAADFHTTMTDLLSTVSNDLPEEDEELRSQLAENDKMKRSEGEVMDRFNALQNGHPHQEREVAEEDDVENSPPASDNEEDEDEESESEDPNSSRIDAHCKAELMDDEEDEATSATGSGSSNHFVCKNRMGNDGADGELVEHNFERLHPKESADADLKSLDAPPRKKLCTENRDSLKSTIEIPNDIDK